MITVLLVTNLLLLIYHYVVSKLLKELICFVLCCYAYVNPLCSSRHIKCSNTFLFHCGPEMLADHLLLHCKDTLGTRTNHVHMGRLWRHRVPPTLPLFSLLIGRRGRRRDVRCPPRCRETLSQCKQSRTSVVRRGALLNSSLHVLSYGRRLLLLFWR